MDYPKERRMEKSLDAESEREKATYWEPWRGWGHLTENPKGMPMVQGKDRPMGSHLVRTRWKGDWMEHGREKHWGNRWARHWVDYWA